MFFVRSIFVLSFMFVFVFMGCEKPKVNNIGSVIFTQPISNNKILLISTLGGKMLVLASLEDAIFLNENLKNRGFTLNQLGVGNVFVVEEDGQFFLVTAKHCVVGLETRDLGADISIIEPGGLKDINQHFELSEGYEFSTYSVLSNDSVFVRGFIPTKDGEIYSATVAGVGVRISEEDLNSSDIRLKGNVEYLQKNLLLIPINPNIDLAGLSGAPAFNKEGKVIGVYSGRNIDEISGECFARISLFK